MAKVLITGTSKGIGLATALELARAGHNVFATMRNPAGAPELRAQASTEGLPITILSMDVDSDESVAAGLAAVYARAGEIDVLVNNAGIERHGAIEELPLDAIREVMETNYFGAVRCIKGVLGRMRERGRGCILNVTSVAGKISSSPLGAYAATKHALEALSEALAQEMRPFGVRVAIVEPGIIDTPMAHAIEDPPPSRYPHGEQMAARFREALEQQPTPPSVVAATIREVIESGSWKLRWPSGPDAQPLLEWRAGMTDEEWIESHQQDDRPNAFGVAAD